MLAWHVGPNVNVDPNYNADHAAECVTKADIEKLLKMINQVRTPHTRDRLRTELYCLASNRSFAALEAQRAADVLAEHYDRIHAEVWAEGDKACKAWLEGNGTAAEEGEDEKKHKVDQPDAAGTAAARARARTAASAPTAPSRTKKLNDARTQARQQANITRVSAASREAARSQMANVRREIDATGGVPSEWKRLTRRRVSDDPKDARKDEEDFDAVMREVAPEYRYQQSVWPQMRERDAGNKKEADDWTLPPSYGIQTAAARGRLASENNEPDSIALNDANSAGNPLFRRYQLRKHGYRSSQGLPFGSTAAAGRRNTPTTTTNAGNGITIRRNGRLFPARTAPPSSQYRIRSQARFDDSGRNEYGKRPFQRVADERDRE